MIENWKKLLTALFLVFFWSAGVGCSRPVLETGVRTEFSGERSYQDVVYQLSLGPRTPGSPGHLKIIEWIANELKQSDWQVEYQQVVFQGKEITNLIAYRDQVRDYILVGAHYDSRISADNDPDPNLRTAAVPGANDGGSGVAVLLELARILPKEMAVPVRLVFFDAEDNGGIDDWEWIMGSSAFVEIYPDLPQTAIIVDMIGDADLNIYYEHNSDPDLMLEIWDQAAVLGYENFFIKEYRHSVLDDHTPFIRAGITAVDIIDLDYPYWHTTSDTEDKVSPESLEVVGRTLLAWLITRN